MIEKAEKSRPLEFHRRKCGKAGRKKPDPGSYHAASYKEALKMAEELDVTLLPYELAGGMEVTREVIRQIKSGQSVGIFIGPEGGILNWKKLMGQSSMGAKVITLGRRILRTETAGLATLAVLMFELEQ